MNVVSGSESPVVDRSIYWVRRRLFFSADIEDLASTEEVEWLKGTVLCKWKAKIFNNSSL